MRYLPAIGRLLVVAIAIAMLAIAVVAFPAALKAARGEGIRGSFTAEWRSCGKYDCTYHGTWRADPPETLIVTDVLMDEWPTDQSLGSSVSALYLGETDPAVVYPAEGSLEWLYILVLGGVAIGIGLSAGLTAVDEFRDASRFDHRDLGYKPRRAKGWSDP